MTTKKELIKMEYGSGKYRTQELANKHGVSIRYVQMCIKECEDFSKLGRTANIKIFTPLDVLRIRNNPKAIDELMERRFKEYYVKRTKKEMQYNIDHWQHHIRRMKLRAIVMEKAEYKCQDCGTSIALELHHVIPVKEAPQKEFDVENCVILCHECHPK
jgi:5-methylcytosine-specific restriction endonuclease McrA